MENILFDALIQRMRMTNAALLSVTDDLSNEQLYTQLRLKAPPIGWHLWHIGRWVDRLQASFHKQRDDNLDRSVNPQREIWYLEKLASNWGLNILPLGVLEAGIGMQFDTAASIPKIIGKQNLIQYARRVFAASEQALGSLSPSELGNRRNSIMEFEIISNSVQEAPGKETTHIADIIFYKSHANRHLGMIKALRGLLDMNGTPLYKAIFTLITSNAVATRQDVRALEPHDWAQPIGKKE